MAARIEVDGVSKKFRLYKERNQTLKAAVMRGGRARYDDFWALRDVSFDVPDGSTFGLIGHNGSGKSTMLKCIARILQPDAGSVTINGRVSALLELGAGFHPELSGRENVYLNGSILGLSRRDVDARFDDIVSFAGLEQFIDMPVKNYSSGMYVRLGFSVAIAVDPDVLLVDEVLAVGDEQFQRKCSERFADLRRNGCTIVMVSHGLGSVEQMCDAVAWLDHGALKMVGASSEVVDAYLAQVSVGSARSSGDGDTGATGELELHAIEVRDGNGGPVERLATGQSGQITLDWSAVGAVPRPTFRLKVTTPEGVLVSVMSSAASDGALPEVYQGDGRLVFGFDVLPLLPGSYDVSVEVTDPDGLHRFAERRKAARLEVAPGNPHGEGGITPLSGTWRFGQRD